MGCRGYMGYMRYMGLNGVLALGSADLGVELHYLLEEALLVGLGYARALVRHRHHQFACATMWVAVGVRGVGRG